MGEDGWELVTIAGRPGDFRLVFRRLAPPEKIPAVALPTQRHWSYRVVRGHEIAAETLNEAGGQGWQLVAAVGELGDFRVVFKRRR